MAIMAICSATYAFQFILDPNIFNYTLNTQRVLILNEWYRIITHVFFHGGIMHLGMNMMGASAIGSMLEKKCGSVAFMFTVLWSIVLTGLLHIVVAFLACVLFHNDRLMVEHGVGYSGVLFHLIVLESDIMASDMSLERSRSVFGFVKVPLRAYPWALLIAISIIMPQVSFMGHLSGILVGTLQTYGGLDWLLPSFSFLRNIEKWNLCTSIMNARGFIPTPTDSELMSLNIIRVKGENDVSALMSCTCKVLKSILKFAKDVIETLKVCIFGYGPILGSNRQTLGNEEW